MGVISCLSNAEAHTLIHDIRLAKRNRIQCYVKDMEKDALQKKERSHKCSVQGIFQSGGMTGIKALKCFGSEDKTGQRTGETESNLLREPQIVLYYWTLRKSKIKNWGVRQKPDSRRLACFHKRLKLCPVSSKETLKNFKAERHTLCVWIYANT